MYKKDKRDAWDKHFHEVYLEYPDEEVIRYLNGRAKSKGQWNRLVDLGCATGRHTVAALRIGYKVTAVDIVEHCINITQERVKGTFGLDTGVHFMVNKNTDLSIPDESVDTILAWGCLFYNTKEMILEHLRELNRVLTPEGEVFCNFRTQKDSMYVNKSGEEIEEETLLLNADGILGGGGGNVLCK